MLFIIALISESLRTEAFCLVLGFKEVCCCHLSTGAHLEEHDEHVANVCSGNMQSKQFWNFVKRANCFVQTTNAYAQLSTVNRQW